MLIVDDNSPDGTAEVVRTLQREFPNACICLRVARKWTGDAPTSPVSNGLWSGLSVRDRDGCRLSHNPADLPRLYSACQDDGADVAVGSRYVCGVNVINWPMRRVLMSYFASKYVRLITGMRINDATAGFVCYRAEVLRRVRLDEVRFVGYAFQIEMKFRAWKYGFHITEVPIVFTDRTAGTSKMSGSIFFEAAFGVIRLKINSLFKKWK